MPLSIGVNLRVTGHCNQGGRKYMEDMFSVAFQSTPDDKDLEYAFFGIFDGHGGGEAASYAKEHLMNVIVKQKNFWSDRDEDVLRAIRDGYVSTHYAMWRELDKWPRTASGLPSTAGTTASIAFIRKGKIYIGHVGDSAIILGYQVDGDPQWRAKALTKDHKPESGPEMMRIRESGGKVVSKSGVPRVVWNRPRIGHKGPVRRSTHIDEIPFLAVARSLGDLWSYNSELNTFVVSPEPDVKVVAIDVESHRCLIFGTDGLWNMLTPQGAVAIVQAADRHNEKHLIASQQTCNGQSDNVQLWINPSKSLVDKALERWSQKRLRADNTSVVTLMLDPPGPSRSEVLLSQKECVMAHHSVHSPAATLSAENLEKPTYNSMSLSVPRPPPTPSHANLQKPELCNRIEDSREEATSEKTLPEEKLEDSLDISHQIGDEVRHTNVEDVNGAGKVAETISHEIAEKKLDGGDNESETSPPKRTDQEQSVENEKQPEIVEDQVAQVVPHSESPATESTESKATAATAAAAAGDSNVIHQSAFFCEGHDVRAPANVGGAAEKDSVPSESPAAANEKSKVAGTVLNGSRPKQQTLFSSSRTEARNAKRKKHSLNGHSRNSLTEAASAEPTTKTYVNSSWFKPRSTKVAGNTVDEGVRNSPGKTAGSAVGTKRRHSAISQSVVGTVEETCVLQEPCFKRRTRSEDRPNPVDENDPANQTTKDAASSLSWAGTESNISRSPGSAATVPIQDRLSPLNTFQRNLGKKVTPVKAIRRPSIKGLLKQLLAAGFGAREWDNRSINSCIERRISRTMSIIGSSDSTTVPQRWLRSDTIAATPVKTLRSRNVDMHQCALVKQPGRLSLSSKLKQSSNNGFLQSGRVRSASLSSGIKQNTSNNGSGTCSTISPTNTGCNTSSGMAKRVKSPYNPSARSLSTRSRIKRLGK